jgi:hypothetical protein
LRDYAKVAPQFWIGRTGKALRKAGPEAQIVALYLMTNPHANMLGMYYLPMISIVHETGLPEKGASKGLARAIEGGFCSYDAASEVVWVHEMARFQIGEQLQPTDKRCAGVQNEYDTLPGNPFLPLFFDRYESAFNLKRKRESASPIQAPSEPHRSQEQEQEQESKSRARPKTQMPKDFAISDRVIAWAEKNEVYNIAAHFDAFVSKARAKGYTYADWDEGFMGAVRDDWAKLGKGQKNGGKAFVI